MSQKNYSIYNVGNSKFLVRLNAITNLGFWSFHCNDSYELDRFNNMKGESTTIDNGLITGKYLILTENETVKCLKPIQFASIWRVKGWEAEISADTIRAQFSNDTFVHLRVEQNRYPDAKPNHLTKCLINESIIDTLSFFDLIIQGEGLKFYRNSIKNIFWENVTLDGVFTYRDTLPSYIGFGQVDFASSQSCLDFSEAIVEEKQTICRINMTRLVDKIDHIKFNYEYFQLEFNEKTKAWEKERIYKQLLSEQQKNGFTYGYIKANRNIENLATCKRV